MESNRMAEHAKAARDAVAELEEPLKSEAFKIILQQLLGGGHSASPSAGHRDAQPKAAAQRRKKSAGGKSEKLAAGPSALNLDVQGIRALKLYCEGFDLNGTEQVAFVLANFAREHTDLEFVSAADIAYLHRLLISQKVKVVAANKVSDWTRALSWLTAPSRRKEWLTKTGSGYSVSNSGLLRWNELQEERQKA